MILLRKAGDRTFIVTRQGAETAALAADKLLAMRSRDGGADGAATLRLFWDDDEPIEVEGLTVYELLEALDDFELSEDVERLLDGAEDA